MALTIDHLSVFLYNFAVVVSGGFIVMQLELTDRFALLGIAAIFAVFWSVYFFVAMVPRLAADEDDGDDRESEPTP
ncbi:hypothetical protein [Natronobiforma cellulositropha]|uniref:hypothetical protein n=1 Tax=Natronobiforma cellulositropha TaxID=1679076 RepID=UPI0021D57664|nr:hypothetical protein [Natronobiforma cellulositropha]